MTADYHLHSCFSGDSETPTEEVVRSGLEKGLSLLCLTEHFDPDYPYADVCMDLDAPAYFAEARRLQALYESRIEIRVGAELGLQPRLGTFLDSWLEQNMAEGLSFDFLIGSTHVADHMDPYDRTFFEDAPVSRQYPQEMYYRLVAPLLLPPTLDRILYLDPDILVINPVRPLWELSLGENIFAAASHSSVFEIMNDVNRARLGKEHDYFNTGVLLIDLEKARAVVTADDVFGYVREQADKLLLPDQDVFNVLYGHRTLQIDDAIFNYDVRYFSAYLLKSDGQHTMNWVMRNTVFLHFCGRHKPWKNMCLSRFSALYQHYMNLAQKAKTNKPYTVGYEKG